MMKTGKVALKIDSVRVYQSRDDDAHGGKPHSVGCDPVEAPTKEFIKGYEYRYMRNPPFVYDDKHPLRSLKTGGGVCKVDEDCGGGGSEDTEVDEDWTLPDLSGKKKSSGGKKKGDNDDVMDLDEEESSGTTKNRRLQEKGPHIDSNSGSTSGSGSEEDDDPTAGLDKPPVSEESLVDTAKDTKVLSNPDRKPKGQCVSATPGLFGAPTSTGKQCKCNKGYTGPHCLSVDKYDDEPGAEDLKRLTSLFSDRVGPHLTNFHIFFGCFFVGAFLLALGVNSFVKSKKSNAAEMVPLRS